MEIFINGKAQTVPTQCSLKEILETHALTKQRVAIEVNQCIIPRSQHDHFMVSDGDHIEIVQAIGGG